MSQMPMSLPGFAAAPLLEMASVLGELAAEPRYWATIPERLVLLLPLSHASLVLVDAPGVDGRAVLLCASASSGHGPVVPEPYRATALERLLAEAGGVADGPVGRGACWTILPQGPAEPLAAVGILPEGRRMAVLVYPNGEQTCLNPAFLERFNALRDFLAVSLGTTFSWLHHRTVLGERIEKLTDREWHVATELACDEPEKLLADRMQLSAHTLHSYTKSIYRKLRVSSRLGAIAHLQQAVREYRARKAAGHTDVMRYAVVG